MRGNEKTLHRRNSEIHNVKAGSIQYLTIPLGYFGGWMVDVICEPFMESISKESIPAIMFGTGKGSGAGMMIFILGLLGMTICLVFGGILKKYKYRELD